MEIIVDIKDIIGLVILGVLAIISICIYLFYYFCSLGEKLKKCAMDKKVEGSRMNFIKIISTEKYNELNEKYEELKVSFEELSKAFEATEHCCPYDNEKCTKTNCFVVGGDCARRSRGKKNDT